MKTLHYQSNVRKLLLTCFLGFLTINSILAQFEEQTGISLPSLRYSSIAWGDYNNDGFLDLLVTGDPGDYNYISKIYKNNGDGTFSEQTSISLTGVSKGSVAWGDYNNDGFLDILLTGQASIGYVSKIYKNNSNGTFSEQTGIELAGVYYSSVAWGDYNNDGWQDILLTGHSYGPPYGPVSKIYKNNGDGTFSEQTNISLTGVEKGSVVWGDYNNDGYLDILLTGLQSKTYPNYSTSKIYKNNGDGTFSEQTNILTGFLSINSASWGDYNNDGFLDIFFAGSGSGLIITGGEVVIFKNNGDGTFSRQTTINFINGVSSIACGDYDNDGFSDILLSMYYGFDSIYVYKNKGDGTFNQQSVYSTSGYNGDCSATWVDYNNDGKLDIMSIMGSGDFAFPCKIYKNVGTYPANTPPAAPDKLQQTINFNSAILQWDKATDTETPRNGLNYNIRIGKTLGSCDIVSPMASATDGYLRKLAMGNTGRRTDGYLITNLSGGTYYWSVQAIDNAFAGGAWAEESTFTVTSMLATKLKADSLGFTGMKLSWTNGNWGKSIVFMAEGNPGIVSIPVNDSTYTANSSFGSGSQIDTTGWYCVYDGTGNEAKVSGLKENTYYRIVVFEYNGPAGSESYNTSMNKENSITARTKSIFEEQTAISLAGVSMSSAAWGDYNNDGFLDILLTGYLENYGAISKIYKNNGNGTFTEQKGISLPGVRNGSVAWGDYNNDGWLDIMINGDTNNATISKVYKNNGNGTFSEQTNISLLPVKNGSVAWADYNNDGFLDIILSGNWGNYYIVKIYKNNGNGTFSEQAAIELTEVNLTYFQGGYRNHMTIRDYNNDGWLDILLTEVSVDPFSSLFSISKVYKNNADGTFTQQSGVSLPYGAEAVWGDYNNDGLLDNFNNSLIYKNNGDGTYSQQTGISLPTITNGSAAWGDYDNDGYLDILLTGSGVSKIYRNMGAYITNTTPTAPSNLRQAIAFNTATLIWDPSTDAQTPQNQLNYNIRLGTTSGNIDIVSPMASITNGLQRKPDFGNAGRKTDGYSINLPAGTYYWSVQAIDNALAGGPWSTESTFTITSALMQTSSIAVDSFSFSGMKLSWKNGNGDKRVVFMTEGNKTVALPVNNSTYAANNAFGSGAQIDTSGWYCIYNGTGNDVMINNLKEATNYKVVVFEYTVNGGSENYNSSLSIGNVVLARTKHFFDEQIVTTSNYSGPALWDDYNNDGYLDILVLDSDTSRIYKNNGNSTFTEQRGIALKGGSSAAWGDYNNDGFLDILLNNNTGSPAKSIIYKNNGDGTFTEQTAISLASGTGAWGDYNNDGLPDIVIGFKIYKNNGDGTFSEQTESALVYVDAGSVTWGDYDNDGLLDILVGRVVEVGLVNYFGSRIFKNNGDGTFTEQTGISLGYGGNMATWGDYNNDGLLDIGVTGVSGSMSFQPISKIYKNNGDGMFTEQTGISLKALSGSMAWGDYNNDGFLDILLTGSPDRFSHITKMYKNNGDGTFSEQTGLSLPKIINSVAWGDYDNDGYLDILTTESGIVKIYNGYYMQNHQNTLPSAPTNLQQTVNFNNVILMWGKATDAQTPQNGLIYNIRVGTTPGGFDIVSPMASTNDGFRRIPAIGNTGQKTDGFILNNLFPGTYYWSVQAIDNAWAGGAWATENIFTITTLQASNIVADSININSMRLQWTKGNGDKRIVFMAEGNKKMIAMPANNNTYTSSNTFGLGTLIDTSGWFCVYNNNGSQVTVTGLKYNTEYSIAVLEYTGAPGNEIYNTRTFRRNLINVMTKNIFDEQTSILLSGGGVWGDYNNDGLLDLLVTEYTGYNYLVKIYKNNGNGSFSEQTEIPLDEATGSSNCWVDYNNDGFLDISLLGYTNSGVIIKIYKNNGNETFSEQTGISLPGIYGGLIAWGDYNNDGLWDILFTGSKLNEPDVTIIYKNNGDGTFSEQTDISLPGLYEGSVSWADYNNDGYWDLLMGSQIYKNNGDGTFSKQIDISLPDYYYGPAIWGDYDNDGYLDLLMGFKIYKNNGDGTFSEQAGIPSTESISSVAFGDYNNDGYLDVLMTYSSYGDVSKIFKNNGDGTFSEQTNISLMGSVGTGCWVDYNNDGYLDVLIGTKIYKNIGAFSVNTNPTAPTNLHQTINKNSISLKWDKATDAQTPQNGLNYNIRIGTTPGGMNIVSPMASTTDGFRRIPAMGNAGQKAQSYIINNLPDGTYYWSVQAIDNTWAGGVWASEKSFSISTNANGSIKFYPNPARDFITIVQKTDERSLVTLSDIQGKIVLSRQITAKQEDVPLNNLPIGLYIRGGRKNVTVTTFYSA